MLSCELKINFTTTSSVYTKLCHLERSEAKQSNESVYFKINWFDRQVSSFARNDTYLLKDFNNLTEQS